jgi:hypothetical protein
MTAFTLDTAGKNSRTLFERAGEQPFFIDVVNTMACCALISVDAVSISDGTSGYDKACYIAGIETADPKADADWPKTTTLSLRAAPLRLQ